MIIYLKCSKARQKGWIRLILGIAGVTTNDVLSHTVFAGRRLRFFPNSAAHDIRASVIKQPRLIAALRIVIFLEDKLFASPQLLQALLDKKSMKLNVECDAVPKTWVRVDVICLLCKENQGQFWRVEYFGFQILVNNIATMR